jgi:MinD-like ATPase involved in chromosome partitioning or flagellar assembly
VREPIVVLAHTVRDWAQDLHFFLMDHGGAIVRGYVMSPDDALAESYDILLVDDVTSYLNPRLVGSLQGNGVKILGVYDPDDAHGAGKQRLLELGVDEALPATTSPAEFVQSIARLAGPFIENDPELAGMLEELGSGGRHTRPTPRDPGGVPEADPRGDRGTLIAVVAASGGAGATEIAIGLAERIRDLGIATALVDADDQAPAVAQRLGLALHPNLRTAVDSVQHGTGTIEDALVRYAPAGLEILCGLPNPRDWFELRPAEVTDVLRELVQRRPALVVNLGPRVEDLPSFGGPARFGVGRAVLAIADEIVLVGAASPIGARRIVDWVADAGAMVGSTPLHVVVNQYSGGRFAPAEIEAELRRTLTLRSFSVVPYDRRVVRAGWEGEPVPRGPFLKAVHRLASRLTALRRAK